MGIKRRSLPFSYGNGVITATTRTPQGVIVGSPSVIRSSLVEAVPAGLQGSQVTESENHIRRMRVKHKPPLGAIAYTQMADVGGPFTSTKRYVLSPSKATMWHMAGSVKIGNNTETDVYDGPLLLLPSNSAFLAFPPSAQSSESQLAGYGTTAIARCAPTNSVANLATAIGELLLGGLPRLVGSSSWESRLTALRDVFRQGGDEYLNVVFGWLPLQQDISDLTKGMVELDRLITQYENNAGKVVRRRYDFPPDVKDEETVLIGNRSVVLMPTTGLFFRSGSSTGQVIRRRTTVVQRWFSGAFTYHLPTGYDRAKIGSYANRVVEEFGLDLDPEVLWNLAPWSWAVDWFGTVGDALHNYQSWVADGLVMRYGYIMEHTIVRDTLTFVGDSGLLPQYPGRPDNLVLVTESKVRRQATPFGFGLQLSGLTARQQAIVAALGISRV